MKRWSVPLVSILAAILMYSMSVSAANVDGMLSHGQDIEDERTGSIEIQLMDGGAGTSKNGVVFAYTKVADLIEGEYELKQIYKKSMVDLNKIEYSEELDEAAKKLRNYAEPEGKCVTDNDGYAKVDGLEIGAYLLYVSDQAEYDIVDPILIAIPTWEGEKWEMLYDVTVVPKHSPMPPERKNGGVKTGDTAYAGVPILVCVMMVMLGTAVLYRSKQKKK